MTRLEKKLKAWSSEDRVLLSELIRQPVFIKACEIITLRAAPTPESMKTVAMQRTADDAKLCYSMAYANEGGIHSALEQLEAMTVAPVPHRPDAANEQPYEHITGQEP